MFDGEAIDRGDEDGVDVDAKRRATGAVANRGCVGHFRSCVRDGCIDEHDAYDCFGVVCGIGKLAYFR